VPATPKIPVYVAPVSQRGTSSLSVPKHSIPQLDQTLLSNDVATPQKQDDGLPIGHLSSHKPTTGFRSQTTSVVPELPYPPQAPPESTPSQSIVAKDDQSRRSTPLPSTSSSTRFAPPSLSNQPPTFVPYSRPSHLREDLMVWYLFCFWRLGARVLIVVTTCSRRSNGYQQVNWLSTPILRAPPSCGSPPLSLQVPAMLRQRRDLWTSIRRRWTSVLFHSTVPLDQAKPLRGCYFSA
jgi:hypothetical protein